MKQSQKLVFLIFIISIFIYDNSFAACTGSSPTWTTTPDYASVSACVAGATSGDTINITAGSGSETWSGNLVITKGINLIGPGADKLTITSNYNGTTKVYLPESYLIAYNPTTPSLREPFRVSGFTINAANKCGCIILYNAQANTPATVPNKIRIDHMKLLNSYAGSGYYPGILVKGMWGVIDNNYVSGCYNTPKFGGNDAMWDELDSFSYGTADNMYFEDNTVVLNVNASGSSSGQVARYAVRYNTYTHVANYSLTAWFDVHGNFVSTSGSCSQYGAMGSEIYGNKVDSTMYNRGVQIAGWRGGKNLGFFNKAVTSGAVTAVAREEYDDAPCATTASQPQHVSDSYWWNNRRNANLVSMTFPNDVGVAHPITANADVWQQNTSYNGTTAIGVYCGTTLPANCTVGDGAWITTQSCSSVDDDNVGAHPNIAISGTLYKCTSPNNWTEYYTPYTYPHPLRTENYRPPTIAVSPTIKDFGTLPINTSSPAQRFTVTTTGGNLNVDAISMTGTDATQFAIQNDSCTGKIIAPEIGSCTFDVKFSPSSVGTKAANVSIVDNDSNTSKLIAVNGTGTSQVPAISFSPTSLLSFSGVLSGTLSSPQTIRVSNTSTNFVTISSLSLSGTYANQFSIPAATDYCTGETVAASGNCSFQVIFSPTSGGEKTANVNLTTLYYSSPATLPLYGSAVVYQSPVPRIKISRKK